MSLPWDRFRPDEKPDEELPYEPPPAPVDLPPQPLPEPDEPLPVEEPPDPTEEYVPPPPKPIPVAPADPADVKALAHDLLGEALDYAKAVISASMKGKDVDVFHPTVTITDTSGKELIIADAKSRSKRTLIQGLLFDLFAALAASIALLVGMDPFVKETWIAFGVLIVKSFVSAGISYFMRLKVTPTIKIPGEKMAVMPIPRPMASEEAKERIYDQSGA